MRNLSKCLENKSINFDKLLEYGFILDDNNYIYKTKISNNHFEIVIEISKEKQFSKVIDLVSNDEYMLVDVEDVNGIYVGKIKEIYENILKDIIDKCTTSNVFKSKQAKLIIKYIKEKYNDDLEFLWEKSPDCAIWRNKINNKWYGLLVVISEKSLGLSSDKLVNVINLKLQKEKHEELVDDKKIFKGYHMNKNNWISIILDESVDTDFIYELIDNSYKLSIRKN